MRDDLDGAAMEAAKMAEMVSQWMATSLGVSRPVLPRIKFRNDGFGSYLVARPDAAPVKPS